MSNKFKKLIIYQAPRHQKCYKASLKQGFIASKMNYPIPSDALESQKCLGKAHNCHLHQITKLSCTLGSFQNNQKLLSFALALTNLRSLCLTINIADIEKLKQFVRKIFAHKKKMTEIKLVLEGSRGKSDFLWKVLGMLKPLVSITIMMKFCDLSMLQSYSSFLKNKAKRNIFPSLKSQQILAGFSNIDRSNFQAISEAIINLEAEAKKYSPCKFNFDLSYLSPSSQSELKSFCSIFEDVQSLCGLTLDRRLPLKTEEEEIFINSLMKSQQLENLTWFLEKEEFGKGLDRLSETLEKLKACKTLKLTVRGNQLNSSFRRFLVSLRGISHLQCLSLTFPRLQGMPNSSLMALGDSLGMMSNLRDLKIVCQSLLFSSDSVEHFLDGLGKCAGLESFCLDIIDTFGKIRKQGFLKLCRSLQNMKNLRIVGLNLLLGSIYFDEEVVEVWNNMMANLSNIVDFSLDLADFQAPLESGVLFKLIESIGFLKLVSTLKLVFRIWGAESEIYAVLPRLIYNLKSLDSFILQLLAPNFGGLTEDEKEELKKIQQKFSYKFFSQFTIEEDV